MRGLILAGLLMTTPAWAADKPETPLSVWRLGDDGSAEHLQTGLRCPAALGDFRQVGTTTYDGFGLDVSCGYNAAGAAITVYLTRMGGLEAAFTGAKQSLVERAQAKHPSLVSDGKAPSGGLDWLRAEYQEDGGVRSDIWMTEVRGWVLKYRATYPAADAEAVSAKLATLTDLVRASAGARLDLCARSSRPERRGKELRDKSRTAELGLMGALLGSVAQAAAKDAKAAPAQPIVFCVEEPLAAKDNHLLSWRGVMPDGQDAHVDRLTPMTVGVPPALETALDSMGNLIVAERSGSKAPERWMATMEAGGKTSIYAYYDRRPSAETLAPLMARILDGKAQPIGGYSVDGKNLNITVPASR